MWPKRRYASMAVRPAKARTLVTMAIPMLTANPGGVIRGRNERPAAAASQGEHAAAGGSTRCRGNPLEPARAPRIRKHPSKTAARLVDENVAGSLDSFLAEGAITLEGKHG